MPLYSFEGKAPQVHPDAFVAPTATLVGDVVVEAGASVWYGAVLRADFSWAAPAGTVFDFISATSHTGSFSGVDQSGLGPGRSVRFDFVGQLGRLTVT